MKFISAVLVVILASSNVSAQVVRGTVVDEGGAAVVTALLSLIDSAGRVQVTALSGSGGRFIIRAPVAGTYSLMVERIGLQTPAPLRLVLMRDATVDRRIEIATRPLELPAITAAAQRRCTTRPAEGEAVALLWEEARKALRSAELGADHPAYRMRLRSYERDLDPGSLRVLRDSSSERSETRSSSPFVSAHIELLLEKGFIQATDSGTFYFAPDAHVLLSDAFADAYCLTPVAEPKRQRVGIRFQPVARSGPPAVTGTLWLDRGSFELRELTYGYTRARLPSGPVQQLGGTIEFERLPDGAWLVQRWRIRMPTIVERPSGISRTTGREQHIAAIREVGGEVLEVFDAAGEPVRRLARASLSGVVFDSVAGAPLAGATVYLVGTGYAATTTAAGEYGFAALPDGRYQVGVSHPRLSVYRTSVPTREVAIAAGEARREHFRVEPDSSSRCALRQREAGTGVLVGWVRDRFSGALLPRAELQLAWTDERGLEAVRRVRADSAGAFVACWLPVNVALNARVRGGVVVPLAPIPTLGYLSIDVRAAGEQPVVTFLLKDWESGAPIQDARLHVDGTATPPLSDAAGTIRLRLPPGTHQIRLEHIAYGSFVDTVDVAAAQSFELKVPRSAIALRGIEVTARSAVAEARLTRGSSGVLLTRKDLVSVEKRARHVGDLLRDIPGITIRELRPATAGGLTRGVCVETRRGGGPLRGSRDKCASVLIVLDGVPINASDSVEDLQAQMLLEIPPGVIESIEYLPAAVAGPRYGTGANNGALVIYTRGNGPYAAREPR